MRGGGGLYVRPKMVTAIRVFVLKRTRPPFIPIGPWSIYKSHKTVCVRPSGPSPTRHPSSLLGSGRNRRMIKFWANCVYVILPLKMTFLF
jgi:hypothetical protein